MEVRLLVHLGIKLDKRIEQGTGKSGDDGGD
jgi:hypothetical protein